MEMLTDRQTDVQHINLIGGLVTRNPPKKPRGLSLVRAKSCSEEVLKTYSNELECTLDRYNLKDSPHMIFNVDEASINTEHSPPHAYAETGSCSQAITHPRSSTTTIITCASATGQVLPPFFVFKGKWFAPDLLKVYCQEQSVKCLPTGWSKSEIFKTFLDHFSKYIPNRTSEEHNKQLC